MKHGPRWVALAMAACMAVAARADSGPVPLTRIALGELGGWIAVETSVGGLSGRWLLDTGASRNLISPALARRLGLSPAGSVRVDTPRGQLRGGDVELPPLRVGGLERSRQQALVIDLQPSFGAAAEGVDGVLGVPWLEGLQVELDLRAWVAVFRVDGAADCPDGLTPGALTRHRTLPVIQLATPAGGERYVLDTGHPGGLLRIEAEPPDATTAGLALPGDLRLTVLRTVTLGTQTRSDVPVIRLAAGPLKRALGDAARGLAGTVLLDGARWRLDLVREQICVETGRFATPGGFGLVPERRGDALHAQFVLPGSPADQAGLRAGDRITQWAGLPASLPLPRLWEAVQGREEIVLTAGEPLRDVTLRRAIFAPAAP